MRLIDADALKEDFKKRLSFTHKWIEKAKDEETKIRANAVITYICEVIMTIDNAPTVKYPFYQEAYQSGYEEGYLKGVKVGNDQKRKICDSCKIHERPQGEWIEKYSDYGVYYRCSICHKMPPNYDCDYKEGAIKTNFCPNCGAEMKGGAEE